jgi:hypothetical protein
LVLDNCSTHKEFLDRIEDMTADDIWAFIIDKETNEGQKEFQKYDKELEKKSKRKREYRAGLCKWVRERNLRDLRLIELCKIYEIHVQYTPAYHPECQPIERFWALFKRRFEDANPKLGYEARVEAALAAMPEDYADKCVQSSLAWCWKKFGEVVGEAGVVSVGDSDAEDSGAEGSDDDE